MSETALIPPDGYTDIGGEVCKCPQMWTDGKRNYCCGARPLNASQRLPGSAYFISASEAPEEYAVVEIFGHRRHCGRVLEVDRFGAKLLRIDVPKDGKFENGYTSHFYGGSSIFSFSPCDLATVERANQERVQAVGRITYDHDDDEDIG